VDNAPRLNPIPAPVPPPAPTAGAPAGLALVAPAPLTMDDWLEQRRRLVAELIQQLRSGFQAVAAFDGAAYLDCVERQEGLCRRIAALDARCPPPGPDAIANRRAASTLRFMNAELKQLGNLQAALIESGGKSVRCFQRVWALGAAAYAPPAGSRY
jgi:hypothetical protein